jgi:hypothetical protein
MAEIKYIPVEIDGVNQTERIERLLQAIDVHLDSLWDASDVNTGFNEVYNAIAQIETGDTNFNSVLTSLISGQTLIDSNGNLLTKGF